MLPSGSTDDLLLTGWYAAPQKAGTCHAQGPAVTCLVIALALWQATTKSKHLLSVTHCESILRLHSKLHCGSTAGSHVSGACPDHYMMLSRC